ncbi:MAG: protein kinase [Muribaculaceae bacterium]|nr:protein kinase [Muribaculaceae bacterium]
MSKFIKSTDASDSDYSAEIDFDEAVRLRGGGTTCDLYKTRWQRREVFVKRLREEYRDMPLYLDALDKEFDIGVSLRHPSLPEYREFHRDYVIIDYIDGSTLADMISRRDPWLASEKHVVRLFRELVDVVGYLHRRNVIHCDIKPDNIMITANTGNLMLIDFDKCYTDAQSDTPGDPARYGLSADDVGRQAVDFRAIGMLAERLRSEVPGFRFRQYARFVKACYDPDVSCEELVAILDDPGHSRRRLVAIVGAALIAVLGGYCLMHTREGGGESVAEPGEEVMAAPAPAVADPEAMLTQEEPAALDKSQAKALDDEQRQAHLNGMDERLYKAFRRKQESKTMYKCVPRYLSIGTLLAMKNMTQNDIEEAVKYGDCFRLRNLAGAESRGKHSTDQLAVEMFPHNTVYGCLIDRQSDITIVCPTALSEAGIGNFSYYLALIGGFNYISKEVDEDIDDPASFYIISDQQRNGALAQYLADVKRLSAGKDRWTIFVISSETAKDADIHFLTDANAQTGRRTTVVDAIRFDRFYSMAATDLYDELGIKSDLNQLRAAGPKNVSVIAGGGMDANTFTIRIFSELIVWDSRYMAVARTLATAMALTLGDSCRETMTPTAVLKESGFGYQP